MAAAFDLCVASDINGVVMSKFSSAAAAGSLREHLAWGAVTPLWIFHE